MKVNINGQGHMTKMATMAINSKNLYKSYSSLTYFMARSAEVTYPRFQASVYKTIGPLVESVRR